MGFKANYHLLTHYVELVFGESPLALHALTLRSLKITFFGNQYGALIDEGVFCV